MTTTDDKLLTTRNIISAMHRASAIVRASCIAWSSRMMHQPSAISRRPSLIGPHRPSCIGHGPCIVHRPHRASIMHRSSCIMDHASCISHQPSAISRQTSRIGLHWLACSHRPATLPRGRSHRASSAIGDRRWIDDGVCLRCVARAA